jgi:two-component system cell cycle sensor histidine kinase/response regulator CckA
MSTTTSARHMRAVQQRLAALEQRASALPRRHRLALADAFAALRAALAELDAAQTVFDRGEQQLADLAEHAPVGLHWLGPDGRILRANQTELDLLGYTRAEYIGRSIADFHADPHVSFDILQRQARGEALRNYEAQLRAKDGAIRYVLIDSNARWEEGALIHTRGFTRDITALHSLEAQLIHAHKLESIGRLAGGIVHDFNNLLTAISGNAELALMSLGADDLVRNDLQVIGDAAARAASLTQQLLAFARKQILTARIANLSAMLLEMDRLLRRVIGEHIELLTLPAPGLWNVKVDVGQIEQVLVNLVVNARDAMPAGGKLTIETRNVVLDAADARERTGVLAGSYVMLAVSDTGIGMAPEVQARLFEPFFTTKEPGNGTGLGLATCYRIIKQHGGNILVYSEVGYGTTFKVYLPRTEASADEPALHNTAEQLPRGSETVLLAEDDSAVRVLAARVLRGLGYTVVEATDGEDALDLATTHGEPIELLLADMVLPRLGGKELAARVAHRHPNIKMIFMSGYTDSAIVHHGRLDAGVDFLQKPFTPAALANKVRAVLDA